MSTISERTVAKGPDEFDPQAVELAREVLGQCRVTLMMAYRFLDAALWRMPFEPAPILRPVESDGTTFWFNPILALNRFRDDSNELVRDMLHVIIHCILRHPYNATHENTRAWWLACDMATEAMVMEMASVAFPSALDGYRRAALKDFRRVSEVITPERIYRAIDTPVRWMGVQDGAPSSAAETIKELEYLFVRDSHAHWPQVSEDGRGLTDGGQEESRPLEEQMEMPEDAQPSLQPSGGGEGEEDSSEGQAGQSPQAGDAPEKDEGAEERSAAEEGADSEESTGAEGGGDTVSSDEQPSDDEGGPSSDSDVDHSQAEGEWEDISRRVQEELETFSRKQGAEAGMLLANVAVSNRKPVDYADFLRRFATRREDMKVNDDEFDYIFYTYGLELYGNMPLVEPLEYQETQRVRDFVIAIDTSGSCSGELVRHFIDRTFQILRESQEFAGRVNVHIVQCDAAIREDAKITSLDELRRFGDQFKVKGMGGTDFRPVFAYVGELIEKGEFDQLGGVIYFTDGYGTFPKRGPDYPTAFVFLEDEGDPRRVPPWAMKVVLRDDQLKLI